MFLSLCKWNFSPMTEFPCAWHVRTPKHLSPWHHGNSIQAIEDADFAHELPLSAYLHPVEHTLTFYFQWHHPIRHASPASALISCSEGDMGWCLEARPSAVCILCSPLLDWGFYGLDPLKGLCSPPGELCPGRIGHWEQSMSGAQVRQNIEDNVSSGMSSIISYLICSKEHWDQIGGPEVRKELCQVIAHSCLSLSVSLWTLCTVWISKPIYWQLWPELCLLAWDKYPISGLGVQSWQGIIW